LPNEQPASPAVAAQPLELAGSTVIGATVGLLSVGIIAMLGLLVLRLVAALLGGIGWPIAQPPPVWLQVPVFLVAAYAIGRGLGRPDAASPSAALAGKLAAAVTIVAVVAFGAMLWVPIAVAVAIPPAWWLGVHMHRAQDPSQRETPART